MIKFQLQNLVKSETPSFDFAKVWRKGGENSSEHHEIFHALYLTRNLKKYVCTLIYQMGISTLSLRLHLKGVKIARNVMKVGVYAYLLKWVPKSNFKFHLQES